MHNRGSSQKPKSSTGNGPSIFLKCNIHRWLWKFRFIRSKVKDGTYDWTWIFILVYLLKGFFISLWLTIMQFDVAAIAKLFIFFNISRVALQWVFRINTYSGSSNITELSSLVLRLESAKWSIFHTVIIKNQYDFSFQRE